MFNAKNDFLAVGKGSFVLLKLGCASREDEQGLSLSRSSCFIPKEAGDYHEARHPTKVPLSVKIETDCCDSRTANR